MGQIVPIYKKGDNKQCGNYRGITLLSIPLKVYEQIIETKLRREIEPTLIETQSGFRKGRSVQDHIFTLKEILSMRLQHNKKTFLAFLDLQKAFDKVPREKVWESLNNRGINPKLSRVIKSLYTCTRNYIISNNNRSEEFETKEGLRQGGVMSPVLFVLFMDEIIRKCHLTSKKLHVGYRNLQPVYVTECAFADDVVIIAGKEDDLQTNLNIWNSTLSENGMEINTEKTKILVVAKEPQNADIRINGRQIQQTQKLNYLGVTFDDQGKQETDITERIEKSNKLYHAMNKNFISKREVTQKTKLSVYKTIFRPTLTYGSESWVLTKRMKSKLEAVEMKYLRKVKGVTLRDRVRSATIREELEVIPVTEFIEKRQLSWWGHLQRMDHNRPVRQVWESRALGKRSRGRPTETWDKVLGKILTAKGKTWQEAKILARNKKEWGKFVHSV